MTGKIITVFHIFSFLSVCLRLLLSMILGSIIGLERSKKGRAAGLRTNVLICIGATLSMLTAQYEFELYGTIWKDIAEQYGLSIDVSRFSAEVIKGIGFIGTGSIVINHDQKVKGLTSAAILMADACMGIAIGSGFIECALIGFFIIVICNLSLTRLTEFIDNLSKDITYYVQYYEPTDIKKMVQLLQDNGAEILDIDVKTGKQKRGIRPESIIHIKVPKGIKHNVLKNELIEQEYIVELEEI